MSYNKIEAIIDPYDNKTYLVAVNDLGDLKRLKKCFKCGELTDYYSEHCEHCNTKFNPFD